LAWAGSAALLALGLLNVAYMVRHGERLPGLSAEKSFDFAVRSFLPGEEAFAGVPAAWPVAKYEVIERDTGSIFGNISHVWTVAPPQRYSCVASLDFPFLEYHDVAWCYSGTGWDIEERRAAALAGPNPAVGTGGEPVRGALELDLTRRDGSQYGYVVYVLIDEQGRIAESPHSLSLWSQWIRHFREGPIPLLLSGFREGIEPSRALLNRRRVPSFS
jgi:hypothetical protein